MMVPQRKCHLAAVVILCGLITCSAKAAWTYDYFDDFDTNQAEKDSFTHSVFWPESSFPPPEPHLVYSSREGHPPRSLKFVGYRGVPAYLGYYFPLGPSPLKVNVLRSVSGTLEFDMLLPSRPSGPHLPVGYLLYSLSSDGHNWDPPVSIGAGHHSIPLSSVQGICYVMFLGIDVLIDNLEVHLNSPGADIRVPEDYPTIQEAVDQAMPGQIIEVGPDVYSGEENRDIHFYGKPLTLRSSNGPQETIIDCREPLDLTAAHRGFYIHEAETSQTVIRGFTVRAGYIPGSTIPPDDMRWNLDPSHPIGAGIYCEFSSPTVIGCVVTNCRTELGAGIGCVGGRPALIHCTVEGCQAGGFGTSESGGRGAGIGLIRQCQAKIHNCQILNNMGYFNSAGAGVYCRISAATISNSNLSFNSAKGNIVGGGLYADGPLTQIFLKNCTLSHNTATDGAGIYLADGASIPDCLDCPPPQLEVVNCTFSHNQLTDPTPQPAAGGIRSLGGMVKVKNSIVWFNEGHQLNLDPSGQNAVTYSDIQRGYPGEENIDLDPLFAANTTGAPDYHLQSLFGRFDPIQGNWVKDKNHSPCIDRGDPADPVGMEPYPNGMRINMGAYGGTSEASKGGCLVYHVDGIRGDDTNSGLTRNTAFATIQRAIIAAKDCDRVLVWPAVYTESINFLGKAITVQSASDAAVLQASSSDGTAVSFYTAEGPSSVLRNFVITNCSVRAIFCANGSPTISHVTVVNNEFGIEAWGNSKPTITNSIFWNNRTGDLSGCTATYSCFQHPGHEGEGNIRKNPLFADELRADYHLRSQRGRFMTSNLGTPDSTDAVPGLWILDYVTSPCIDRGDPSIPPQTERMPNGARLNMGAYGGTAFASMSEWPLRGDFNQDGEVDLRDFAIVTENWLIKLPWAR